MLVNEEVLKTDNTKNVSNNAKVETLTFKHSHTQKPYEEMLSKWHSALLGFFSFKQN